jgi:hypothetical protein
MRIDYLPSGFYATCLFLTGPTREMLLEVKAKLTSLDDLERLSMGRCLIDFPAFCWASRSS